MDGSRFDALATTLTVPGARRRILGLLALLPIMGGLAGVLDLDEAAAKDRRRRRKGRHKRRKNPGSRKKRQAKKSRKPQPPPPCQSPSVAQTCADQCGTVTDACGKTVECGSCDCTPACGACLICQSGPNTRGECVPDPAQDGDACDVSDLCITGRTCSAGVCSGGSPVVCPANDCQTPGTCNPATGSCTSPTSRPTGTTCASQPCGVCDGTGVCVTCSGTTPICSGTGTCVACSATNPCPSGCCNEATGACVVDCPACQTCDGGICVADPAQNQEVCAGSGAAASICCNGVCCDGCCDGDGACGACLAFVTDNTYTGNLGGLAGADALCQDLADANELPGTYTAWLSISNEEDESPASGRFRHSGQPYTRLDGVTIAEDWADLISGALDAPLNVTETGQQFETRTFAWTNTNPDGSAGGLQSNGDCQDWLGGAGEAGNIGDVATSSTTWTRFTAVSCSSRWGRLYCFQQS